MHFLDEAKIFIQSGKGGNGCVSFLREANLPKGGPNGGDGAKGGDVIIEGIDSLNTLIDFRYQQHFRAQAGAGGQGKNKHGAKGEDLIIKVPYGTQIFSGEGEDLITDITIENPRYKILEGGKGGAGNSRFRSSTNQRPFQFESGGIAQSMWIRLKLKLISDIGLVGLPNAGKSTFISVVSRAKPKIADYPFTTLIPNLGVVYIDQREYIIADIPGLIEGAHQGNGLGDKFLKHIERCKSILHIIDVNCDDIFKHYNIIRKELENYSELLSNKDEIVVLNKTDLFDNEYIEQQKEYLENKINKKVYLMSTATLNGVEEMKRILLQHLMPEEEEF